MTNRKKQKRADPRELPAYSISEAAHYLGIPDATVRYWAKGQKSYLPLIDIPDHDPTLLSFLNLTELHILAAIRRKHDVSMPKVRTAIEFLSGKARRAFDKKHPLISKQLQTDGLDLFVEMYGDLVNISQAGQVAMRSVLGAALQRIERDPNGIPIKLYPFTRSELDHAPSMVVIDPALSSGRPVLVGTGLATEIISERYKAGDSITELARDYGRKKAEIEEAIRCELRTAA